MPGKTGLALSVLGFDASPLGRAFAPVDEHEAVRAINTAIELGMNFIDVSPFYGRTRAESVPGNALKTIPRDAYYLSTKVGRHGNTSFDFSAEPVTNSIEFGSLGQVINETIPALRRLQTVGKIGYMNSLNLFPS